MTLTTHAIIGALTASFFPTHPEIGFVVAFGSHFAIDAIPHFDYSLYSAVGDAKNPMNNDMIVDRRFVKDLFHIGLDILIGIIVSIYILMYVGKFSLPVLAVGVLGGIIPDALQFVYMKFRHEPLISLQRFHIWIQRDRRLKSKPFLGILSQIILIVFATFLINLI